MNEIIAIARNTFKEAIRNRILYVILMFALILIAFSGVVSSLTISSQAKVIKDMGFMAINLFGVAIAVFVGVSLVYNELEKKTIYTIVSKPIGRWQFLLGKYFGLLMTVWVNVLIMTVFFLIALHYYAGAGSLDPTGHTFSDHGFLYTLVVSIWRGIVSFFYWTAYPLVTANIMPVILMTCLELMIVTAFAVLYSSFSTPTLSMFFTVLTFIAGRLNEDIIKFADQLLTQAQNATGALAMASAHGNTKAGAALAAKAVAEMPTPLSYHIAIGTAHIVPNLGSFQRAVEQAIYEPKLTIWPETIIYAFLYTIAILSLSILIFNRRNFK